VGRGHPGAGGGARMGREGTVLRVAAHRGRLRSRPMNLLLLEVLWLLLHLPTLVFELLGPDFD